MSSLREPGLGPIVGHTTSNSCRLWVRAADPDDKGSIISSNRRTIGVLTVLERGKPKPNDPARSAYFRLHREYDRTGTFNLGVDSSLGQNGPGFKLKPNTSYEVRLGTIALDDSRHDDEATSDEELAERLPPPEAWAVDLSKLSSSKSEALVRTFPKKSDTMSFMIGSCHYPGLLWKKRHSDRIFGPMIDELTKKRFNSTPGFVLMVGDQIYADMFNRMIPIGLADTYEEFQDRYLDRAGQLPNSVLLLSM